MSHHILHLFAHGCLLAVERGRLVCRAAGSGDRSLPLDDLRAVVIAARGVTLSAAALSALLERGTVILHCDERYQPCGLTLPLPRVVDLQAFNGQLKATARLREAIWQHLLRAKTRNQIQCLTMLGRTSPRLERSLKTGPIVEGDCARHYWKHYFPAIGWKGSGREQKDANPPNACLNYGYAVLSALCHRSLILHGLNAQIGVFHRPRYRADPLLYDLMEPFRPFVDALLARHLQRQPDGSLRDWAKHVGTSLRDVRVRRGRNRIKLLDAIDLSASMLARTFASRKVSGLWFPEIDATALDAADLIPNEHLSDQHGMATGHV